MRIVHHFGAIMRRTAPSSVMRPAADATPRDTQKSASIACFERFQRCQLERRHARGSRGAAPCFLPCLKRQQAHARLFGALARMCDHVMVERVERQFIAHSMASKSRDSLAQSNIGKALRVVLGRGLLRVECRAAAIPLTHHVRLPATRERRDEPGGP
ncbi:hypothetical protein [Paraburkholderia heleia]|uniref:hypothetical protein n=1 Tax=Paraburkholderia heleia TaxID=634127 RepID=UPI0031DD776A